MICFNYACDISVICFTRSHKEAFEHVLDFLCTKHGGSAILKAGSDKSGDKKAYLHAVKQNTAAKVAAAKEDVPSQKARDWISKIPDATLFPTMAKEQGYLLHGRQASQTVESINGNSQSVRDYPPARALFEMAL